MEDKKYWKKSGQMNKRNSNILQMFVYAIGYECL